MLSPIDIVDRFNRPTGKTSTPEKASNRGQWHRGAHVFVLTPSGNILVQKRSLTAMQRPGLVDLGAGGFVDSGEFPEETAVRELQEETGISVTSSDLIFLGTSRYNHRWKTGSRRSKITRAIIYNYAVRLPHDHNALIANPDEVTWVGFIPAKSALWLIIKKSSRQVGRLIPTYAYYRKWLRRAFTVLDFPFH